MKIDLDEYEEEDLIQLLKDHIESCVQYDCKQESKDYEIILKKVIEACENED